MRFGPKKMIIFVLIFIIVSLIATAVILAGLIGDAKETEGKDQTINDVPWFITESINSDTNIVLSNAYVVSTDNDKITFLYENKQYEVKGSLSESYQGVANIEIEQGRIQKVYSKSQGVQGRLLRYTQQAFYIEGDMESIEIERGESLKIYCIDDEMISEGSLDSLIIGGSYITTVIEENKVVALLVDIRETVDYVSVLIRDTNNLYHDSLYVKKEYEDVLLDIQNVLKKNQVSELFLSDKIGFFICDEKGTPLGERYEGDLYVLNTEQGLILVNRISMESYIKYVVPSEMPRSFHPEALKAQAICARTFAYLKLYNQDYAEYGANLDNSTEYQVYHASTRFEETDKAVDETKGLVMTYNNQIIPCYFYSCNGGVGTDLSVWNSTNPDYIKEHKLEDNITLDLSKEEDFHTYIEGDYESLDQEALFYRWQASLDLTKVKEAEHGLLQRMEVNERNSSGYITKLTLIYENKSIVLSRESEIRETLTQYLSDIILPNGTSRMDLGILPSVCFEIIEMNQKQIVLSGGGYGHGIGFSQYGSNALAQKGLSYEEILNYYFAEITLDSLEGK